MPWPRIVSPGWSNAAGLVFIPAKVRKVHLNWHFNDARDAFVPVLITGISETCMMAVSVRAPISVFGPPNPDIDFWLPRGLHSAEHQPSPCLVVLAEVPQQ